MKKQKYWYKVFYGKWDNGEFEPQSSFIFVTAWSATHASKRADKEADDGEVVMSVEYLGYPQC